VEISKKHQDIEQKKIDSWFKNYALIHRLRWMIIEFGIPFLLGTGAISSFNPVI